MKECDSTSGDGNELIEPDCIYSYILSRALFAPRHDQVRITQPDVFEIGLIYISLKLVTKKSKLREELNFITRKTEVAALEGKA